MIGITLAQSNAPPARPGSPTPPPLLSHNQQQQQQRQTQSNPSPSQFTTSTQPPTAPIVGTTQAAPATQPIPPLQIDWNALANLQGLLASMVASQTNLAWPTAPMPSTQPQPAPSETKPVDSAPTLEPSGPLFDYDDEDDEDH